MRKYLIILLAVALAGKIQAEQIAVLKFQTSGLLSWVGVKKGDRVLKNQAIASLDTRELKKSLEKSLNDYGVVDQKGSSFGGPDFDNYIFVPLKMAFNFAGNEKIQSILLQAENQEAVATVKGQAEALLSESLAKDSFSVVDQAQILTSINAIIGTLTLALTGIAAISLLVGGIGIMNIMLVSVTERTREIGLRKAIGGTPRAIWLQFLVEAVILSCLGGLVGILLGSAGTLVINRFFPAQVTPNSILLAFGVSAGVGITFGVTPARKASQLSPIEALRYE